MMIRLTMTRILTTGSLLVCAWAQAVASPYPDRPIRFLVPVTAGGGADISSRAVAALRRSSFSRPNC